MQVPGKKIGNRASKCQVKKLEIALAIGEIIGKDYDKRDLFEGLAIAVSAFLQASTSQSSIATDLFCGYLKQIESTSFQEIRLTYEGDESEKF